MKHGAGAGAKIAVLVDKSLPQAAYLTVSDAMPVALSLFWRRVPHGNMAKNQNQQYLRLFLWCVLYERATLLAPTKKPQLINGIGITADALQELCYAAEKSGVTVDAFKELQVRAVDAKAGEGEAAEAFQMLSLKSTDAAGQAHKGYLSSVFFGDMITNIIEY